MAKRGRKPSNNKEKFYFGEIQEQAVLDYLQTPSKEEKNRIWNEILRPAFKKMIESIIRRYNLFIPDEDFTDTFNDTLSFLLTKFDKYDVESGKKAYSYYGTICRNYLTGRIHEYSKILKRNPTYDSVAEEINNNVKYSNEESYSAQIAKESVEKLICRIKTMTGDTQSFNLKENEIKLGNALRILLENWDYVLSTDGSNKLNKNTILLFLRDKTGLNQKEIRDNMKKFKQEFLLIKDFIIS